MSDSWHFSLDPTLTFNNYVSYVGNEWAIATVRRIIDRPSENYGLIYIYGHPGSGKSHLLHAAADAIARLGNRRVARCLRCDECARMMIASARLGQPWPNGSLAHTTSILLLDNVDYLKGKSVSQQELVRTIDYLIGQGRRIVVTGTHSLSDMGDFDPQLLSRLQGGIAARIDPPDYLDFTRIMRSYVQAMNTDLPQEMMDKALEGGDRSIRSAQGEIQRAILLWQTYGDRAIDIYKRQKEPLWINFTEDAGQIWEQAMVDMRRRLADNQFRATFAHAKLIHIDNQSAVIEVPNQEIAERIKRSYQTDIDTVLGRVAGIHANVEVTYEGNPRRSHTSLGPDFDDELWYSYADHMDEWETENLPPEQRTSYDYDHEEAVQRHYEDMQEFGRYAPEDNEFDEPPQ